MATEETNCLPAILTSLCTGKLTCAQTLLKINVSIIKLTDLIIMLLQLTKTRSVLAL